MAMLHSLWDRSEMPMAEGVEKLGQVEEVQAKEFISLLKERSCFLQPLQQKLHPRHQFI